MNLSAARKSRIKVALGCVVFALICIATVTPPSADELASAPDFRIEPGATIPRICATRDLGVTMMIEKYGEARTISGEQLMDAYTMVMEARNACIAERYPGAMAIYDGAMAYLLGALPDNVTTAKIGNK